MNAHLLVQQGSPPPDNYYHEFLLLGEKHILPPGLASALAPSAGLRNRLVHEYDDIIDTIVLDAVRTAQDLYPKYVAAVEVHLSK